MKRTRILALLLAAVVMVMMAIILLPKDTEKTQTQEPKKEVIVARQAIPAYAEITEEMLEKTEYPESAVAPNAVTDLSEAVGCRSLVEISAKEVLMSNHLLKQEDIAGGLALLLDDGMRAMSVRVDDVTGISNLLKVGNKVDVIVVLEVPEESLPEEEGEENAAPEPEAIPENPDEEAPANDNVPVSKMILQNIEVVALNTALIGTALDDDGNPGYTTVTLAVLPQDAVSLALACREGSVFLIERPQNDNEEVETTLVKIEDIIG